MPDETEDKERTEKELKEKGKPKPFWESLPPVVLIGGVILIFLAIRSMTLDPAKGNTQILWIIGVIVVLIFLAKSQTPLEPIVSPKESELLVERELERKLRWGQFPMMSVYKIGPVSDLMHRDARGRYYNVAVQLTNPFHKTLYFTAKVMASGLERGFVTFIQSVGPLDGRTIHQETDVTRVPEWVKRPDKYPMLEKIFFGR